MAFCSINTIKNLALNADNIKETLLREIEKGKINFENTKKILLPPLISKPDDVWQFQTPKTQPNFITLKIITAPVALSNNINNINGSIVCIPNADPGFDWLFSYDLAGLITAWGGANSHMAIRAFELELPAVIGVGDILYKTYSNAKRLFIDCSSKRIEVFY